MIPSKLFQIKAESQVDNKSEKNNLKSYLVQILKSKNNK